MIRVTSSFPECPTFLALYREYRKAPKMYAVWDALASHIDEHKCAMVVVGAELLPKPKKEEEEQPCAS